VYDIEHICLFHWLNGKAIDYSKKCCFLVVTYVNALEISNIPDAAYKLVLPGKDRSGLTFIKFQVSQGFCGIKN